MPLPKKPLRGDDNENTPPQQPTPAPMEEVHPDEHEGFLDFLTDPSLIDGDIAELEKARRNSQSLTVGDFDEDEQSDNTKAYATVGELTAEQVIETPYRKLFDKELEVKIQEMTQYVQETINEKGLTEAVGEARRSRGKEYNEMVRTLDLLILKRISQESLLAKDDVKIFVAAVINEILGFGPIEPLWRDPTISEIMVNGPYDIRIESNGKKKRAVGVQFRDQHHLLGICQQMLGLIGRSIDVKNPTEDGSLPDGSRVNVVHPSIAPSGPFVTIRRFPDTIFTMEELVAKKSMDEEMALEIGNLVHAGASMIIIGGTSSGKTSFLNAISGCIPDDDRVVTIEDTLELRLNPRKHVIAHQARPKSASGGGAVTIRTLMRNALRQAPNRVIVGEVRDGSAYDMLQAMNTGHEGSLTTVHANDAEGAVERIALLVNEAGEIKPESAMSLIAGGVDIFVVIDRFEDGSRRVVGIYEVPSRVATVDGTIRLDPIPLWEFVHDYTDKNEVVHGHYEKKNDLSASFIKRRRLDKKHRLTLQEIYDLSSIDTDQIKQQVPLESFTEEDTTASESPEKPEESASYLANDDPIIEVDIDSDDEEENDL